MRVNRDEVLEKNDDARSERGSKQRCAAAQGDHEKRLHRGRELKIRRADKAIVVGPQHSGKATEAARNHKADVFMKPHMIAQRSHAGFALSDSHEAAAERRPNDHAKNAEGNEKSCERKEVNRDGMD